ncbi:hypothetical protein [Amycolatopsis sp. NPDC059657]|uniref:hypothetical protein n=1 Tax=Amycolatopsis sp. NPDC059657 TaxID=3346899 RepID=UPI00367355AD
MPTSTIGHQDTCDLCGNETAETTPVYGKNACQTCADDYAVCDHCDTRTADTSETTDGGDICSYCARNYFYFCDACDRYAETVRGTASGSDLCDSCAIDYWGCEGCGDLIDGGDYCESCEEDRDEYVDGVHDYSYKPYPEFHGTGPLFLGAEIEINTPTGLTQDCADVAVRHLKGLGYLKEDCSIDHGFEIVTHPMSYGWAMERFPWAMLADLRREGCSAYGNGLHVHISRAAFDSPAHVYRWMKLLHRNASKVTTVARRVSSQWAAFSETDRKNVKEYAKGIKGAARYQAINTQNDDTFELRVFASSLNPQQVQAALALAAASVEYTRELSIAAITRAGGWAWSAFTTWLRLHPEYAPLTSELEELACAC